MPAGRFLRLGTNDAEQAVLRLLSEAFACKKVDHKIGEFVYRRQLNAYRLTRVGSATCFSRLKAERLFGDRGCDADWLREALKDKGMHACTPGGKQRKKAVKYDKRRYKRRNRIEIVLGKLKDWRRVANRYDRCPKAFLSALALAALVIYWL